MVLSLLITGVPPFGYLGEVPERRGVVEVKNVGGVVGQNPGKDGVLVEVVVRTTGDRVEVHEVVEVRDLSPLPFGGYGGPPEQLVGLCQGGGPVIIQRGWVIIMGSGQYVCMVGGEGERVTEI